MARGISIHVGVNNVDPNVYGSPLTLRGCENDARDMQTVAAQSGFDMAASTLLLSRDATAQNVTGAIRAAATSLGSEDILFLTYSGHGGQVPDPTGVEDDARNETWVLYDRQLIDDELNSLWARFAPGTRIFVLSDSCHSGTVIRDIATGRVWDSTHQFTLEVLPIVTRQMAGLDNLLPATKALPFDVQSAVYERDRAFYDGLPRGRNLTPAASVLLISGCQDNQVSLDGSINGLFTEKLLSVWRTGNFTDYGSLHSAITRLLPPTQSPNYYTAGTPAPQFERQRPLTIEHPATGTVTTPPNGLSWLEILQQSIDNWKDKGMAPNSKDGSQTEEKWIEFIPMAINLGMQVVDALSKEGFQIQDSKGQAVVSTKDVAGSEKWLQFIPLAVGLGLEVYDALSKEGALPADKQVPIPKDFSPDDMKGWLDLVPIAIDIGSQVYHALTKEGYVATGAVPQAPQLNDPAAKGWLDLIPVALDIGSQVFNALTKAGSPMPAMTKAGTATPLATKEVVGSFSHQVLKAGVS